MYTYIPVLTQTFKGKGQEKLGSHFPFQLCTTTTAQKSQTPTSWQPPLLIGQQVQFGGGAFSHCVRPTVWCQVSLAQVITIHTNTLSTTPQTHPIPKPFGKPRDPTETTTLLDYMQIMYTLTWGDYILIFGCRSRDQYYKSTKDIKCSIVFKRPWYSIFTIIEGKTFQDNDIIAT